MKKGFKKLFCFILTLMLSLQTVIVYGENKDSNFSREPGSFVSSEITPDVIEYAKNIVSYHMEAMGENYSYSVTSPFSLFDSKGNVLGYEFPIVCQSEIRYLLTVKKKGNELSSYMDCAFVKDIQDALNHTGKKVLWEDGNNIYISSTSIKAKQVWSYNKGDRNIKSDLTKDTLTKMLQSDTINDFPAYVVHGTRLLRSTVQHTLPVEGVNQGDHPICWAATCAAMINYIKGGNLTAYDVASYVFPGNPYQRGQWDDIKKAYTHYFVSASQSGKLTFSEVKAEIENDHPLHLGLKGHSVGLIGYKQIDKNNTHTRMLILLEPNGGIKKTITLKNNGNFDYYLSEENSWVYSRKLRKR